MKKVLILEDDSFMRELWTNLLSQSLFQCQVDIAVSELYAHKMMSELKKNFETYDLIICDIFLSGNKTGLDFWKSHHNEASKFIFSSGVSEVKFHELLPHTTQGCFYLEKPLDLNKGLILINQLLGS